ncbi:THAP domain-containing protein 5-like [Tribolium madens]|uniref:THAP domain-containing protein 5-like n=1 Tax=Tribolium madens TaxID=41895 RepID=UPI001CF73BEF|nr:THAP domain-containing protein 5-like [Tribolium madens]
MTGTICSVAICKSNAQKAKRGGEKIKFFSFPKNPEIRKEWVRRCHRKDKWDPRNKRICSKHFTDGDYQDSLQAKLLNIRPEKLKPTAVPSLYLLPQSTSHRGLSKGEERKSIKQRKQIVNEVLETEDVPILDTTSAENAEVVPSTSSESEVDILRKEINTLIMENEKLKKSLKEKNQEVTQLQQKISELESPTRIYASNCEEKMREALSHFLTPNQLDIVLQKKKKAR